MFELFGVAEERRSIGSMSSAMRRSLESSSAVESWAFRSSLRYGPHELDMDQARQLAEEIEAVRAGESDELAHDLDSIASVAWWCADAPERDSWLTIIGP
jgi:hypothetical protein